MFVYIRRLNPLTSFFSVSGGRVDGRFAEHAVLVVAAEVGRRHCLEVDESSVSIERRRQCCDIAS